MRFSVHHEGADYDNPEEVIVHDSETGFEIVLRPNSEGFGYEIHDEDLTSSKSGVVRHGD